MRKPRFSSLKIPPGHRSGYLGIDTKLQAGFSTATVRVFVTIGPMLIDNIVAVMIAERDKLNRAIAALEGPRTPSIYAPVAEMTAPGKKRHVSAATRRKMALGQKKRYAALKAAKS
jgi:hypothetical protein